MVYYFHLTTEETKPHADENNVYRSSIVYARPRPKPLLCGGKPSNFSAIAEMLLLRFSADQKSRGQVDSVLKLFGSLSMQRELN